MVETCVCCGYTAGQLPYVGIGRRDLRNNTGPMVAHSVCAQCFVDPEHRTVKNLKIHFMPRYAANQAVSMSNELDRRSKRGEPLNLGG